MCIAVGNVSFDDCPRLTWSFGWTGFLLPSVPPASSIARFEITSFAFMFVCVPLPVCQTNSGKWSSSLPSITSSAARTMRSTIGWGSVPSSPLVKRRGLLEDAERADQRPRKVLAADAEVMERPLGLRAPVAVGGDGNLAHAVGLDAGRHQENSIAFFTTNQTFAGRSASRRMYQANQRSP